jgi:hypothetical protein
MPRSAATLRIPRQRLSALAEARTASAPFWRRLFDYLARGFDTLGRLHIDYLWGPSLDIPHRTLPGAGQGSRSRGPQDADASRGRADNRPPAA